jgi:hypothetical protein
MWHINMLLCEVVEKPKSAEGWILLLRLRQDLNLAFRQLFIWKTSGLFEEALSPVAE